MPAAILKPDGFEVMVTFTTVAAPNQADREGIYTESPLTRLTFSGTINSARGNYLRPGEKPIAVRIYCSAGKLCGGIPFGFECITATLDIIMCGNQPGRTIRIPQRVDHQGPTSFTSAAIPFSLTFRRHGGVLVVATERARNRERLDIPASNVRRQLHQPPWDHAPHFSLHTESRHI